MAKMFEFITCPPWNPIGGKCIHDCVYCWAKRMIVQYDMEKYKVNPYWSDAPPKFKEGDFVFMQDMNDLYAENVPTGLILQLLTVCRDNPNVRFLSLTKNPKRCYEILRFLNVENEIPSNVVWGSTIESNINYPDISKAPLQCERLAWLLRVKGFGVPVCISVEPILDFNNAFSDYVELIMPEFVAVGYDNYGNKLPEPTMQKTLNLVGELEKFTKVYRKTIRKAYYE